MMAELCALQSKATGPGTLLDGLNKRRALVRARSEGPGARRCSPRHASSALRHELLARALLRP